MIDKQEQAFADLILMGWDASEAFRILYPQSKAKGGSIKVLASRLKTSPEVANYLQQKDVQLTTHQTNVNPSCLNSLPPTLALDEIELDENYASRTNQIKRYKWILDSTSDEKVKLMCLDAITKITGLLKTREDEKQRVIFYLPLRCYDCKLFKAEEEKQRAIRKFGNKTKNNTN